eukprot:m.198605 g.198605  ORF g.198605 m.198605 type:complete len:137 (-) comp13687_c1_seq2:375-785(-)
MSNKNGSHEVLLLEILLGKMEYLVKWEGFDNSHNTWEPKASLINNVELQNYIEMTKGKSLPSIKSSKNKGGNGSSTNPTKKRKRRKTTSTKSQNVEETVLKTLLKLRFESPGSKMVGKRSSATGKDTRFKNVHSHI